MPKRIASNDPNLSLNALVTWVEENNDVVILEVDGTPQVVLVPYRQYEEFLALRGKWRQEGLPTSSSDSTEA